MNIGDYNTVRIIKREGKGYFVKDTGKPAFLSDRYLKREYQIGDELEVFIYTGSNAELLATLEKTKLKIGHFAALEVLQNSKVGTFVDWGLNDDLLVPFDAQDLEMEEGEKYIVNLYIDEQSGRLRGTTMFYNYLSEDPINKIPGDEVTLLVVEENNLGVVVIINDSHEGLLYKDEVYQDLKIGDRVKGFIKKIREDGKIDVTLQTFGYRKVEPNADHIVETMQKNGGFLDLHDKSDPEEIKRRMNMSKKTFKKALGALYKKRIIEIKPDGVYLVK